MRKKQANDTNDLNKSAAIEAFEERSENKSHFPTLFWLDNSKERV